VWVAFLGSFVLSTNLATSDGIWGAHAWLWQMQPPCVIFHF
jgi:hypothetical protein